MLAFHSHSAADASSRTGFVLMTLAPVLWGPAVVVVQALGARYRRWRRRREEEADASWLPPPRRPRG